jgi:hypothetical protein
MERGTTRVRTERERFERAFVAAGYLVGWRGALLTEALPAPSSVTQKLAQRLTHPERQVRAQVLAAELGPLVTALDSWRYR